MNAPETSRSPAVMVDVQGSTDTRQIAINKVGIKAIRHPVKVLDKSGGIQHTIAIFNMYVGLPHNFKGPAAQLQGHPHVTFRGNSQQPRT